MRILLAASAACLLLCAATPSMAQFVLRVGYVTPRDSHFGDGVEAFRIAVEQGTGTRVRVQHLPEGIAGGELALINKLRNGELEMASISSGPLGNLIPEVRVLDLPYLFTNYAHAQRVLDGQIGQKLLGHLSNHGVIGLAWTEHGFRHMTNNKRHIVYPEDLANLKLRTMENKIHQESLRSLSVSAVPLPFPNLRTALRTGEVDGQENPLSVILAARLFEQQKYLSLTNHFYSAGVLLMSPAAWKQLSEADQKAVQQAAREAAKAQRLRVSRDELLALDTMRKAGVEINGYVSQAAFRLWFRKRYPLLLPDLDPTLLQSIIGAE